MSNREKGQDPTVLTKAEAPNQLPESLYVPNRLPTPSRKLMPISEPTRRHDTRLSSTSEVNPGRLQGSHRRGPTVKTHANGQTVGPALKREMERSQKTAVMASSPKVLSGKTRAQGPKSRVSAGEITAVTPTRSPKKVKGRGKAKGQRQPLGLMKIKLPSDFTNSGRLDPAYL